MSANALTPVAQRIAQCIRLLASDRDGEVVAAARALQRTLASVGLDLHALAERIEKTTTVAVTNDDVSIYWHQDMAVLVLDSGMRLNARERDFLNHMTRWSGRPTERQKAWLEALIERSTSRRRA